MNMYTQTTKYFNEVTINDYFEITKYKFPFLYDMLDENRFSYQNMENVFSSMNIIDFEGDSKGGRGKDYFVAQNKYPLNRSIGFTSIFDLIGDKNSGEKVVLDLLGGNGTLYRAAKLLGYDNLKIIINDISEAMVENAFNQGIPCIRQPAQDLLFKNNCLDAVIYAYGTHHIPMEERLNAFKETNRVLKKGGVMVFHDYEEGSITSRWYSEVLHKYTYTGHDFIHFYKDQLQADLETAGFEDVKVFYRYDPFIIEASSEQLAKENLVRHLISLFGLKKFSEAYEYSEVKFLEEGEKMVRKYCELSAIEDEEITSILRFTELTTYEKEGRFYAEMPRFSLMATGVAS